MRILKAQRITNSIYDLYKELHAHQDKCRHVKSVKTHKSNTGNMDRNDDSYWTEFKCPTCLKSWTEEGSL